MIAHANKWYQNPIMSINYEKISWLNMNYELKEVKFKLERRYIWLQNENSPYVYMLCEYFKKFWGGIA